MLSRRILIAAIVTCTAAVATMSAAQKEPAAPTQGQIELINLDFKGGSVTDYIESLRRASSQANIVMLNDLGSIPMPAVKLTSVDVPSALQMLEWMPRRQEHAEVKVIVRKATHGGEAVPVYTVMADIEPLQRPPSSRTVVFAISDLLKEDLKVTDVLTAVETALGMLKDQPQAQVRFHERTGLLIAHGRSEQLDSMHQVITQLRERKHVARQEESGQLREELERCRQRVGEQEHAIQELRKQLGQSR